MALLETRERVVLKLRKSEKIKTFFTKLQNKQTGDLHTAEFFKRFRDSKDILRHL